jgi:hypothetical protein
LQKLKRPVVLLSTVSTLQITIEEGPGKDSPPFATNTRLLVAAERGLRRRLLVAVDEDAAGLEAERDFFGGGDVFAPDAGSETGLLD